MRAMLIDWMFEVGDEYAMSRETCHISIRYVDLYLSREECPIERLQLLGPVSLMISYKMEEVFCPRVSNFSYATDNGFNEHSIIEIEARLPKLLNLRLQSPTIPRWANYSVAKFHN